MAKVIIEVTFNGSWYGDLNMNDDGSLYSNGDFGFNNEHTSVYDFFEKNQELFNGKYEVFFINEA